MAQIGSSRWYPTAEQVAILREMYRGGVRSLSGSQIQEIAAHLSLYGRIEAKNVFYWFQNRKARDRQKLRRRLTRQNKTTPIQQHYIVHPQVQTWFVAPAAAHQYPPHGSLLQYRGMEETTPFMTNLVCKMETSEREGEKSKDHDWVRIMNLETNIRPLETLELFPTRSNGDLRCELIAAKSQ